MLKYRLTQKKKNLFNFSSKLDTPFWNIKNLYDYFNLNNMFMTSLVQPQCGPTIELWNIIFPGCPILKTLVINVMLKTSVVITVIWTSCRRIFFCRKTKNKKEMKRRGAWVNVLCVHKIKVMYYLSSHLERRRIIRNNRN